jgi:hypothetical protein
MQLAHSQRRKWMPKLPRFGKASKHPILFYNRKHLKEEAAVTAGHIAFEASLDDPESIALYEYFSVSDPTPGRAGACANRSRC